jgi:hypothetical protein
MYGSHLEGKGEGTYSIILERRCFHINNKAAVTYNFLRWFVIDRFVLFELSGARALGL